MPGDLQIESLAAGLAHGAAGVGTRVEGEDVFLFDMEGGEGAAQTVVEQLALDPDFIANTFFRIKGSACGVQAIVRFERSGGVGEQADFGCQLIQQSGPLRKGVVVLAAGGVARVIVDALLEPFETRTEHASQRVSEEDLILQVQGSAFDVFEEVSAGTCTAWFRLAIDRLENVDGVGAAGDGRHALVLAVVLVFTADQ